MRILNISVECQRLAFVSPGEVKQGMEYLKQMCLEDVQGLMDYFDKIYVSGHFRLYSEFRPASSKQITSSIADQLQPAGGQSPSKRQRKGSDTSREVKDPLRGPCEWKKKFGGVSSSHWTLYSYKYMN